MEAQTLEAEAVAEGLAGPKVSVGACGWQSIVVEEGSGRCESSDGLGPLAVALCARGWQTKDRTPTEIESWNLSGIAGKNKRRATVGSIVALQMMTCLSGEARKRRRGWRALYCATQS